jgi:transcriptional regulator with XRE-family HTH domain
VFPNEEHDNLELVLAHRFASKPQKVTELAKRIRDVRLEIGLNQSEFAAEVGVSSSTCSQWESGAFAPRKALLERISRAVPDQHKAYFLEYKRPRRRQSLIKDGSKMSVAELDLLEEEKVEFVRKLRSQLGHWLKNYKSVHVQVKNLAGQRFVYFSVNSPENKGVVVFLDKDLARASRTDVHASQLRGLNVDWASLLLPFGQRWASLKLLIERIEQTTPQ